MSLVYFTFLKYTYLAKAVKQTMSGYPIGIKLEPEVGYLTFLFPRAVVPIRRAAPG